LGGVQRLGPKGFGVSGDFPFFKGKEKLWETGAVKGFFPGTPGLFRGFGTEIKGETFVFRAFINFFFELRFYIGFPGAFGGLEDFFTFFSSGGHLGGFHRGGTFLGGERTTLYGLNSGEESYTTFVGSILHG